MRTSGVLMPISSLPSPYGIGTMGKAARKFVDFLKKGGQKYWQILPISPTSFGDSPYQSFSSFAGNPYFISLEALIEEGVLTKKECDSVDFGDDEASIDYEKMYKGRYKLLRLAYERSNVSQNEAYNRFVDENSWWLKDYALFMSVKDIFDGNPWNEWAEDIRLRYDYAMDYYRRECYFDIEFHQYMQFKFYEQWMKLKSYANYNGVRIIGDIPIYVAMDSADAWAHPELFQLDEHNVPTAVAGCPPDCFNEDGQLWADFPDEAHRPDITLNEDGELILSINHISKPYSLGTVKPVRGVDYWTDADKAEIVNSALEALPNAEGVKF